MARFYDAMDSSELARIETLLKNGGVEYTLSGADDGVREILVAEEDLAFAERLISSSGKSVRQRAGVATR